jgi:peptide deformylase
MLDLIKETDPILKQTALPWDFETQDDPMVVENEMLALMKSKNAIGLAANQVGMLRRVFVMRTQDGREFGCFNPEIVSYSTDPVDGEEGCLSFPNLWLKIKRHNKITAAYLDNAGKHCIIELEGIDARCFQHELDHLDGITFTGYVSSLKLQMARKKQRKLNG